MVMSIESGVQVAGIEVNGRSYLLYKVERSNQLVQNSTKRGD